MKRHAYLILAHHRFGQLRKLVELLDDERNDIFVHIDRKAAAFNQAEWEGVCCRSGLHFLDNRLDVRWGGVSIMRAELALLEAATQQGEYDYYHLLSGMDLPIKPQDEIHDFFDRHSGTEFINFWEYDAGLESRFRYYTIFPEGEKGTVTRLINHAFKKLQRAVGYRINSGVDFCYASQWFSITDSLARYVLSQRERLERIFCRTTICDEIFLATLVWNSPFRERLYVMEPASSPADINLSNMRLVEWGRSGMRHPWTFRNEDWELLRSTPHFWARKFDEQVDPQIIDRICSALKPK